MSEIRRGLDAPKTDAQLLAEFEAKTGKRVNGVELGPNSPMQARAPAPKKRAKRAAGRDYLETEHDIQCALFRKIRDPEELRRRPQLAMVHAVPNGGYRTIGAAQRARDEGQEPGVLDIDCPVARGGYIGFRLELKVPGRQLSPSQIHWLAAFEREGHRTGVYDNADVAFSQLTAYLDLPVTTRTLLRA